MRRVALFLILCGAAALLAAQQPALCPKAPDHYHLNFRFLELVPDRRLPVLEGKAGQLIGLRSVAPPDLRERITSIVADLQLVDGWLVERRLGLSASYSPEDGVVEIISNRDSLTIGDLRELMQALGCIPVRSSSGPLGATIMVSIHDGFYFVSAAGSLVLLERDQASGKLRFSERRLTDHGAAPGYGLVRRHLVDGVPLYVLDEQGQPCTTPEAHHRRPIRFWDHHLVPNPGLPAALTYDEYWAHSNQVVFSANTAHLSVTGDWPWPDTARWCPDGRRSYTLLHPIDREPAILFTTLTFAFAENGLEVRRIFADVELVRNEPAAPVIACDQGRIRRAGHEQDSWTLSWSLWCELARLLEQPSAVAVEVSADLNEALESVAPSCAAAGRWQIHDPEGGDPFAYLKAWGSLREGESGGEPPRSGGTGS